MCILIWTCRGAPLTLSQSCICVQLWWSREIQWLLLQICSLVTRLLVVQALLWRLTVCQNQDERSMMWSHSVQFPQSNLLELSSFLANSNAVWDIIPSVSKCRNCRRGHSVRGCKVWTLKMAIRSVACVWLILLQRTQPGLPANHCLPTLPPSRKYLRPSTLRRLANWKTQERSTDIVTTNNEATYSSPTLILALFYLVVRDWLC